MDMGSFFKLFDTLSSDNKNTRNGVKGRAELSSYFNVKYDPSQEDNPEVTNSPTSQLYPPRANPLDLIKICATTPDAADILKLQVEINDYFLKATGAQLAFMLFPTIDEKIWSFQVLGRMILKQERKFRITRNDFLSALQENRAITCNDISSQQSSLLTEMSGINVKSFVGVPILNPEVPSRVALIMCLVNNRTLNYKRSIIVTRNKLHTFPICSFTKDEEDLVREAFSYIIQIIINRLSFISFSRRKRVCQEFMSMVTNQSESKEDKAAILKTIIKEAKSAIKAEAFSLFLVGKSYIQLILELVREHYSTRVSDKHIPLNKGILGSVASSGQMKNVLEPYSHPDFEEEADDMSDVNIENMLCFPIQNGSVTFAVGRFCNKDASLYFTEVDEDVARILGLVIVGHLLQA